MLKVKVCGLKDPVNVKEICETGIDYAGFIFFPKSPRYIGNKPDTNIFNCIPDTIGKVGVFVDEEQDKLVETAINSGIGIIQLHGNEDFSYCKNVKASGLKVIKVFRVDEETDLNNVNEYSEVCDYFLFDTRGKLYGGSGKKFNWDVLNGADFKKPFFLSGGIGSEDVPELKKIKNEMFFGIDINSRFEISPGIKDFKKVKAFIKKAKYEIQC